MLLSEPERVTASGHRVVLVDPTGHLGPALRVRRDDVVEALMSSKRLTTFIGRRPRDRRGARLRRARRRVGGDGHQVRRGHRLLPFAFLRLIKMIIAPLVFATLVVGIAKMGDIATVGRVGGKALAVVCRRFTRSRWCSASLLCRSSSRARALNLPLPNDGAVFGLQASGMTLKAFIEHTLPTSAIDAMARNEILQIVVFSLFFGTAMAALGRAQPRSLLEGVDALAQIMLKVTGYVMNFAPLAVLGALAGTVAKEGLGIIGVYGLFIGEFYLGLAVLWGILIALGVVFVGPGVLRLVRVHTRSRCCSHSPPRAPRPPIHARSKSSSVSAAATASRASCCRSGTRSISTAR